MKFIITIALMVTSLSTFADTLKCVSQTENQIESVAVVSKYKLSLIKTITQSDDEVEAEKASSALEKLDLNIAQIAVEACAAVKK